MARHTSHKKLWLVIALVIVVLAAIILLAHPAKPTAVMPIKTAPAVVQTPQVKPVTIQDSLYHTITIATTNPTKELTALVGADNVQTVLEINRIDANNVVKGRVLIVPNDFSDTADMVPFPTTLAIASDIPKLMVVSNVIQAFAIYESGTLVRWGGVNTGKQSTPTPSRLYFTNWKGKSVVSSEDDSWVLPWYFNLDNKEGISMHQYELPGYPASHACVRMFEQDAEWVYNWADQWKVSDDGETILAYGTPVIVFGQYDFTKTAPWKNLAKDPTATTISSDELEGIVAQYKPEIVSKRTVQ